VNQPLEREKTMKLDLAFQKRNSRLKKEEKKDRILVTEKLKC
jgi:hypothetical protein